MWRYRADAHTSVYTNANANIHGGTHVNSHTHVYTSPNAYVHTGAHSNCDPNTDAAGVPNAHVHAGTHADADCHAKTDTYTIPYGNSHTCPYCRFR